MKNAKGTKAMSNNEKMKPVALAIIELHIRQLVSRK